MQWYRKQRVKVFLGAFLNFSENPVSRVSTLTLSVFTSDWFLWFLGALWKLNSRKINFYITSKPFYSDNELNSVVNIILWFQNIRICAGINESHLVLHNHRPPLLLTPSISIKEWNLISSILSCEILHSTAHFLQPKGKTDSVDLSSKNRSPGRFFKWSRKKIQYSRFCEISKD